MLDKTPNPTVPDPARGAHQVIALRKTCDSDSCRYDDSAGTDMMSGPSDSLRARARRGPLGLLRRAPAAVEPGSPACLPPHRLTQSPTFATTSIPKCCWKEGRLFGFRAYPLQAYGTPSLQPYLSGRA